MPLRLTGQRLAIMRLLWDHGEMMLTAGMSAQQSGLERAVAIVLEDSVESSDLHWSADCSTALMLASGAEMMFTVPRVQDPTSYVSPEPVENSIMRSLIAKIGLLFGLLLSPMAPLPAQTSANSATVREAVEKNTEAQPVPENLENFSGMLIGKLVARDIEQGSFTVKVDHVARVWENNKSREPRAAVGKTLRVDGVTGKWLDQLLLVRPGETVEFEAQHRGGEHLRFPGEWLKKVPPFDAADHPVPPDGFRGFAGVVQGKIVTKRQQSREFVLRIDSIKDTFDRNRAKKPADVVGKRIVLAGFWAQMSKPFDRLKDGDTIRVGVLHRVPQSDHFTVIEFAEKVNTSSPSD